MAVNIDALKAKLDAMNNRGQARGNMKSDLWKPDYGKHVIRPIAWPEGVAVGDTAPFLERWFYYGLKGRCVAPKLTEPDPVRELRDVLFDDRTEANLKLAKQLRPKMRCFLPVIVDGEDSKKEVKIWSISQTVYKQLIGYIVDPAWGDFTDAESGRQATVEISDSGKKFDDGTKIRDVDVRLQPDRTALTQEELAIVDSVPDIDSIYPISTYDALEEALNRYMHSGTGKNTETRGGSPQQSAPAATGTKPKTGSLEDAFDDLLG